MSLVAKTLAGLRWTTLAMVTNVTFNIGYTALMARLLTPAAFGLVAMAQIAIRFLSYFAQLGVSPALVQKPKLSERDIRAALTVSVTINSLLFGFMWAVAPFAGSFFSNADIIPILRGLATAFLFSGLSVISMGLLRRDLMFKHLAVVEIFSYVVGYGLVGIGSALQGMGTWSLVFALIGQEAITLIISYAFVRHSIRPSFIWADISYFLSYGSKYSAVGFLEYIGQNIDSVLIGRWLGETVLGLYNRAQMVVKLPMHHIGTAITKVLFPVLSSAQKDKQKLAHAYLVGWLLIGSLASAISLSLIPAASDAVLTLLGSQWVAAIPIVEIAAFAVPFAFLTVLSGIVCDAQGLLWPKLIIQIIALLTLCLSVYLLMDEGVLGFAKAMVITEVIRLALYVGLHLYRLPISATTFIRVNLVVIFIALTSMFAVNRASHLAFALDSPAWVRLILEIVAGGATFALSFAFSWFLLREIPAFTALRNQLPLLNRFK